MARQTVSLPDGWAYENTSYIDPGSAISSARTTFDVGEEVTVKESPLAAENG
jgi:hypothetical protein